MDAIAVIAMEDTVIGSIHQITVEMSGSRKHVRINGTVLPYDHEFTKCVIALTESWSDHFEGLMDCSLDDYINELGMPI